MWVWAVSSLLMYAVLSPASGMAINGTIAQAQESHNDFDSIPDHEPGTGMTIDEIIAKAGERSQRSNAAKGLQDSNTMSDQDPGNKKDQHRQKRKAISSDMNRRTNKQIPYQIQQGVSSETEKELIHEEITERKTYTCFDVGTHPGGFCVDYTREDCPQGYRHSYSGCGFEEMCCYKPSAPNPIIPSVAHLPTCASPYTQGHCLDGTQWTCPNDTWTYYDHCQDQGVCCYPKSLTQTPTPTQVSPLTTTRRESEAQSVVKREASFHPCINMPSQFTDGYCIDNSIYSCPTDSTTYANDHCSGSNEVCCFPDHIGTCGPQCSDRPDGYCIDDRYQGCPSTYITSYSGCGYQQACCYPQSTVNPTPRPTPRPIPPTSGTQCGKPTVGLGHRIVGGENTVIEAHPWQVMIRLNGKHNCGGSLINSRWVLTAAHCLETKTGVDIVVGTTDNSRYSESQVISVEKFIDHPNYHYDGSDIALIKLSKDIDLTSPKTKAVCLADSKDKFDKKFCIVSGWGWTTTLRSYPNVLKHVTAPVVDRDTCIYYMDSDMNPVKDWEICAGHATGGKDACRGDSGGPLVCQGSDGFWKLAGVVSSGEGCALKGKLGLYSSVAYVRSWIDGVISQN